MGEGEHGTRLVTVEIFIPKTCDCNARFETQSCFVWSIQRIAGESQIAAAGCESQFGFPRFVWSIQRIADESQTESQ